MGLDKKVVYNDEIRPLPCGLSLQSSSSGVNNERPLIHDYNSAHMVKKLQIVIVMGVNRFFMGISCNKIQFGGTECLTNNKTVYT